MGNSSVEGVRLAMAVFLSRMLEVVIWVCRGLGGWTKGSWRKMA